MIKTTCLNSNINMIHIIKDPLITDKATRLLENNQYTFLVHLSANKILIKEAIQNLFDVKVKKINTTNLPKKKKKVGKYIGWKPNYKKAIVTLSDNDKINLFSED